MTPTRTLHAHQGHLGWNRAYPPVATVAPGDTIETWGSKPFAVWSTRTWAFDS